MKKKLIILVCLIGLVTVLGLSENENIRASYDDIPYVEANTPTS